ncbi:ABC transporter-like protein [Kalmanozyma brasiliensis GHG001]|uniref:ABC transporter-like protein n=1 Tax=Kalmanozyma brasiliensis (strain GHG001) TaxID=1365824 RepID=UPI001CE9EC0E|nr:ABC transporter-like protein [Kalmanozyma brasiliensis GHG001]EST09396.2 ABC transporter-like protein [Kalmanozyma brasiliensis GHG001]
MGKHESTTTSTTSTTSTTPISTKRSSPSTPLAKPTIRLLFTFLTPRDALLLLLPALLCSLIVGLVPTAMSKVVGHAFDAFTSYNPTLLPPSAIPSSAHHRLMHSILSSVYLLLGLAAACFVISTLSVSAWICLGERAAARARRALFEAVMGKRLAWYDTGMGLSNEDGEEEVSPAGLMTKCARELDDLRVALSREVGNVVQHVTTALASLVLALYTSWSLTLVILASIPVVLVLTVVTEIGAAKWLQRERVSTAHATSMVERVIEAINTVKAFNAQRKETTRFEAELKQGCKSWRKTLLWWAARFGVTSGLVFATFVQGFWFGSHLVGKGKITPGQVMTVFMASLLVSSTMGQIVQALTYIDKGKIGAANLVNLINSPDVPQHKLRTSNSTASMRSSGYTDDKTPLSPGFTSPRSDIFTVNTLDYDPRRARAVPMSIERIPASPSTPTTFTHRHRARRRVQNLRRIAPTTCLGEIHLRNLSFAYPSRPSTLVLDNVSLYFPAGETTYVVGGSGSGKSTIAQLLLRLYEPSGGSIQIDDQVADYLDPAWIRRHVGAVSQDSVVFDMSVHDNIALGLATSDGMANVSRADVENACRLALLHEFIRDLPDGYDTMLGAKGTALSGGQRQRLAIARARLRDPSVLILDEATSALDPTTRHLVHEAIKAWRKGKTTIVITHDLSQIEDGDFLYLLENGRLVQQGYRADLEAKVGAFQRMAMQQSRSSGQPDEEEAEMVQQQVERTYDEPSRRQRGKYRSMLGWEREGGILSEHLSLIISQKLENVPSHLKPLRLAERQAINSYFEDAEALRATGSSASHRRARNGTVERKRWDAQPIPHSTDASGSVTIVPSSEVPSRMPTVREVSSILWRTIPSRALLLLGMLICVLAGTLTTIFSFILAKLLATMGRPDQSATVLRYSLLVLLIAFLEGIFAFTRYLFMETLADEWLLTLRTSSYRNVISQDRTFFDRPSHTPARVCQSIVKDGDDARGLVGQIIGQLALIASMITLGIVWAMVVGWKLTLAGVAFGPVFLAATFLQSRVIGHYEARNKLKREIVSARFHDMVSHIRAIRTMALEGVFATAYGAAVDDAQRCGMRSAVFAGFGHGLSEALTYIAEALIFYVGARLIVSGEYDFGQMMQVFNLIIFAVTFAAQMLTFLPGLSKSMKALADLDLLLQPHPRSEATGSLTRDVRGNIEFRHVSFAYSGRDTHQVLQDVDFGVSAGEVVAIVGASGCGKSTVAALLQRLYHPTSGEILLDGTPIDTLSVEWLREHISVVGQNPSLFDTSIAHNIAYGANAKIYEEPLAHTRSSLAEADLAMVQDAARAANAHSFITTLPGGYDTSVGGATAKLSGGQAQRLAIARALMRVRARVLILDECTSALDVANQQVVVETLLADESEVRRRRMTTLVITHNVEMMRRCDRVLVLKEGRVVEQGKFENLVKMGGYFASLTRGGEWTG